MNAVVQSKNEILSILKQKQVEIRKFGIKRLGLFGSFVTGKQGVESNVDLLVEFESGQKSFDHFMDLSIFLEDVFGRHIELVTTDALSPYLGPHILSEVENVIEVESNF